MEELHIEGLQYTRKVWDAFARVLCNTSTVEETQASNHSIHSITTLSEWKEKNAVPEDVSLLLHINKSEEKALVARRKIIDHHFTDARASIHRFTSMELNVLPHAMEWIGEDDSGLPLMLHLIHEKVSLFEAATASKGGRRKKRQI